MNYKSLRSMNATKVIASSFCLSLIASVASFGAAITTVSFDTGSRELRDFNQISLISGGQSIVDHDGAVLQLGYFTGATQANPFGNGNFIALSGEGSANSAFANTTVGDAFVAGAGDGTFALQLSFDDSKAVTFQNLPAVNTPLSIRIYNRATIALSTFFETVSSTDANWLWKAPGLPPSTIALSFDDPGLRLKSTNAAPIASDRISTTTPVPEPTTFALVALVGLFGVARRNRK